MQAKELFTQTISQNQGIILKISRCYSNTTQDCQDLSQEICLQLWKSWPTFKEQSKITTWMYRVCLNTAISFIRKQTHIPHTEPADHLAEVLPADSIDLSKQMDLEDIYKGIRQLKDIERSIVLLWLDDLTYEEITEITGLSQKNISVRLVRIKEKLKFILNPISNQEA